MPRLRLAVAVAIPFALAACASSGAAPGGSGYDRNRISPNEITAAQDRNVNNVYDLVLSTRPTWLRLTSGGFGGSAQRLAVYMDRTPMGGVEALRSVTLANVNYVRYLAPSEAGGEFGLDVNYGVIQIVMRR